MRLLHATLAIGVVLGVTPSVAHALTAREILDQAKQLDDTSRHWTDRTQKMTMHLFAADEAQRTRELRLYTKRYVGGDNKSICFLLSPVDMNGIGFLQWTHKNRRDEQWLYLPQYRRTRRIAAPDREEGFLFTDFTYSDLDILAGIQGWTQDDTSAQLLGGDNADGNEAYTIELQPRRPDVAYGRIVMWLDRLKLIPRKLDFYDREGSHVKTLALSDIRDIGTIPTPLRLEMRNLKTDSHTVVEVTDTTYDTGLLDELFTPHQLEMGGL
jgi:outer membrane lipoprotein-sorting protein